VELVAAARPGSLLVHLALSSPAFLAWEQKAQRRSQLAKELRDIESVETAGIEPASAIAWGWRLRAYPAL